MCVLRQGTACVQAAVSRTDATRSVLCQSSHLSLAAKESGHTDNQPVVATTSQQPVAAPSTANTLWMMITEHDGAGGPLAMMGVLVNRTDAMATAVCRGGWKQNLAEHSCLAAVVLPDLLPALVAAAAVPEKVHTSWTVMGEGRVAMLTVSTRGPTRRRPV